MSDTRRKVDLYMLSLGLLFLLIVVFTANVPVCVGADCKFVGFRELVAINIVSLVSGLLFTYSCYAYIKFSHDLRGAQDLPFEITKIESINYEHLTFLATYLVPLISFDLDSVRQALGLLLLLVAMGAIYIKTDLFYANPSLALLGFQIYRANGSFKNDTRENIVLICRGRLRQDDKVGYIKLDERIYFVERKNE